MEIITTFTQSGPDLPTLFRLAGLAGLSLAAVHLLRTAWSKRPLLRISLPRALSFSALPVLMAPASSVAMAERPGAKPIREIQTSPALDARVPPPRSLVRAGGISHRAVHPAIHASPNNPTKGPLFPRVASMRGHQPEPWERGVADLRRTARLQSVQRHPGGSAQRERGVQKHYVVLPGDTLWGIAAKVLGTEDQRAIARYWPRIHRASVDVIGKDPNLLRPGQVLSLPPKEPA